MNTPILPEPEEHVEDLLGLCHKVCHDNETGRQVFVGDLRELRDMIDALFRHCSSAGYKTVPKISNKEL